MQDIVSATSYLNAKKGWIKKSPLLFQERLSRVGINLTIEQVKTIQKELRNPVTVADIPSGGRLFYDIETSPNEGYFWRTGSKLMITPDAITKERAIICISWKWENDSRVFSLRWDDKQCDKTMLEQFVEVLHASDEAIGHNADNFDIRWVRARCMIHGIPISPFIKTVDTLKFARSLYLNSRKLDYISKILGSDGKIGTNFGMWKRIMKDNSKEDLDLMVLYCEKDVIELERIHSTLRKYNPTALHRGILADASACSCPECASETHVYQKKHITARGTISHQLRCADCNTYFIVSNSTYNKRKQ